eukprot:g11437.t1
MRHPRCSWEEKTGRWWALAEAGGECRAVARQQSQAPSAILVRNTRHRNNVAHDPHMTAGTTGQHGRKDHHENYGVEVLEPPEYKTGVGLADTGAEAPYRRMRNLHGGDAAEGRADSALRDFSTPPHKSAGRGQHAAPPPKYTGSRITRAYMQELHRQYVPATPTSLADAQQLCEYLAAFSQGTFISDDSAKVDKNCSSRSASPPSGSRPSTGIPDLIPKFVLDHSVPAEGCNPGLEVTYLMKHADRWTRLLPKERHQIEMLKMLQLLCGCFRVPHLLQLLLNYESNNGGPTGGAAAGAGAGKGRGSVENGLFSATGISAEDEDVLPQTYFRKTATNSTLAGRVCTQAPPPSKLRERRCGDVHVSFAGCGSVSSGSCSFTPANKSIGSSTATGAADYYEAQQERSLFVSNLPFDCDEQAVRAAYETFGAVEEVEIFSDRLRNIRAKGAHLGAEKSALEAGAERVRGNRYSSAYAILRFAEARGVENASRDFFRLFGVLVTTGGAAPSDANQVDEESRSTFPERARHKNVLLLTGLPWQFPVATVLREVGRRLGTSGMEISLRLANSGIFEFPQTNTMGIKSTHRIEKLEVRVTHGGECAEVVQSPAFDEREYIDTHEDEEDPDLDEDEELFLTEVDLDIHEIIGNKRYLSEHHNDGVFALRFPSYAQARLAKALLTDFTIGDRAASVDFSPRRRHFVQFDAEGRPFRSLWDEDHVAAKERVEDENSNSNGSSRWACGATAEAVADGGQRSLSCPRSREILPGRFVDFMTPEQSAVYADARDNPFYAFGKRE